MSVSIQRQVRKFTTEDTFTLPDNCVAFQVKNVGLTTIVIDNFDPIVPGNAAGESIPAIANYYLVGQVKFAPQTPGDAIIVLIKVQIASGNV